MARLHKMKINQGKHLNRDLPKMKEKESVGIDQAYLDSLPSHDDVFKPYFHDSGTGIDQGCTED